MKTYSVNIDEDVYNSLNNKCTFIDNTPNKVLRKLLLPNKESKQVVTKISSNLPTLPISIEMSLRQTLNIIHLVLNKGYSRVDAKNILAKKFSVTPETIHDKYTRILGKSSYEIDRMLNTKDVDGLMATIINRFPHESTLVDDFFKNL